MNSHTGILSDRNALNVPMAAPRVERRIDARSERYRNLLSQTALFASVDLAALDDLAASVEVRSRTSGSTLASPEEPTESIVVLVSGRAKVVLLGEGGREFQLRLLGAGDIFGETSVVDGLPRSATVIAIENVTLLVLDRETMRKHLLAYPQTAMNLLSEMCTRVRAADENMTNLALFDVEARLARTLLRLAADAPVGDEGVVLVGRPTQQELANMVGSCRETVSRSYSSLVRRGLLVPRGRELLLTSELLRKIGRKVGAAG